MRSSCSMLVLFVCVSFAMADLDIIQEFQDDPRVPEYAQDPVSSEIIQMELQEGYVYDKSLACYNRTKGIFDHTWGFKTTAYYGELWEYNWASYVIYVDDNYIVEYIDIAGNKNGNTKIIVESKRELTKNLSKCLRDIAETSPKESQIFGKVGPALFQTEFLGLNIITHEDGKTIMSKNDDVRGFQKSLDFAGKQYVIINNLKERGGNSVIRRVVLSGTELVEWRGATKEENENNIIQTRMLENAILGLDRSIVPGNKLYKPGSEWEVASKGLKRCITPYTRVDKFGGKLKFKTDDTLRKFKDENCFKFFTTSTKADSKLEFIKQLVPEDKKSTDKWDKWYGGMAIEVEQFYGYIQPHGRYSFVNQLYSQSIINGSGAKSTPWALDSKLEGDITSEVLYYCIRQKKRDRKLRARCLGAAQEVFESTFGAQGENCPWK
jgi:hypothetical protein